MLDDDVGSNEDDGYVARDGITDVALDAFRKHYTDPSITKDSIFYYTYGVLHSEEYRELYASDLKKLLPRIPMALNFRAFEEAGRKLAALHVGYETLEPWPVVEDAKPKGDLNDDAYYRVDKMRFASAGGREKDKSVIVYNSRITLRNIPLEAYDYVVNSKSAIDWIVEQYKIDQDKESGIPEDPNAWCREHNDPTYILTLLKRVIRVSVETMEIVRSLPLLQE